jgi:hypothetical protein
MAIVLCESFGFLSAAALQTNGWTTSNGPSGAQSRFGHNSLWVVNATAAKALGASYSEAILSGAIFITSLTTDDDYVFVRNGSTVVAKVMVVTSGGQKFFRIRNVSNTVLGTGTTPLAANTWYHIQFRVVVHASTGQAELRLNGAEGEINASNVNTGSSNIDTIAFWTSNSQSMYVSDVVVQDTSGSAPWNTFLGDTRFVLPLPTGNSGTNNAWTANTGTKYGAVDEVSDNGDTDYISSATPGDRQTFTNAALGVTGTVFAVQVTNHARKDDATVRTIAPVIRQGGVNYDGTTTPALSTSYIRYKQIYQQGPDGADWDVSRVDAAEFGVKMVS